MLRLQELPSLHALLESRMHFDYLACIRGRSHKQVQPTGPLVRWLGMELHISTPHDLNFQQNRRTSSFQMASSLNKRKAFIPEDHVPRRTEGE